MAVKPGAPRSPESLSECLPLLSITELLGSGMAKQRVKEREFLEALKDPVQSRPKKAKPARASKWKRQSYKGKLKLETQKPSVGLHSKLLSEALIT